MPHRRHQPPPGLPIRHSAGVAPSFAACPLWLRVSMVGPHTYTGANVPAKICQARAVFATRLRTMNIRSPKR